jgi:hypothetical protein
MIQFLEAPATSGEIYVIPASFPDVIWLRHAMPEAFLITSSSR